MAEMISVAEAAQRLEVSHRRVRQLIAEGELDASRVGGAWMLHPASVERRRLQSPSPGRPLEEERVWAIALFADQIVEDLARYLASHGVEKAVSASRRGAAQALEEALQKIRYLSASDVMANPSAQRQAENDLRGALAALRRLKRIDDLSPSHFESIVAQEERASYPSRPARGAVGSIDLSVERDAFKRLRNAIAHGREVSAKDLAPFRSRSHGVVGHFGHPSVIEALHDEPLVLSSGSHAAAAYGADLVSGGRFDGYVNSGMLPEIASRYGLEQVPLGEAPVWLRPVPSLHMKSALAPRLFVAADLLERRDPRGIQAALRLLEQLIAALNWAEKHDS